MYTGDPLVIDAPLLFVTSRVKRGNPIVGRITSTRSASACKSPATSTGEEFVGYGMSYTGV
jgi:hypothetical protein